jgi:hypothetical protein
MGIRKTELVTGKASLQDIAAGNAMATVQEKIADGTTTQDHKMKYRIGSLPNYHTGEFIYCLQIRILFCWITIALTEDYVKADLLRNQLEELE